ncbi:MAG: dihydroxy-acid dehydratase [Dehalococcoidales bacterium]|nr:dihydroxy-acid dehydratase [Dehalococcoidales bacterium]
MKKTYQKKSIASLCGLENADIRNVLKAMGYSDDEMKRRLKGWEKPEPKVKRGYLSLYSRLASSADEGAVIKYR